MSINHFENSTSLKTELAFTSWPSVIGNSSCQSIIAYLPNHSYHKIWMLKPDYRKFLNGIFEDDLLYFHWGFDGQLGNWPVTTININAWSTNLWLEILNIVPTSAMHRKSIFIWHGKPSPKEHFPALTSLHLLVCLKQVKVKMVSFFVDSIMEKRDTGCPVPLPQTQKPKNKTYLVWISLGAFLVLLAFAILLVWAFCGGLDEWKDTGGYNMLL